MSRRNRLFRLFRALSDQTQQDFGELTGIDPSQVAHYELGDVEPGPDNLARAAAGAGLTVADGEAILDLAETLRQKRRRAGSGVEPLRDALVDLASAVYRRLLALPRPDAPPRAEDRQLAAEQWQRLQDLSADEQLAVLRTAPEFHNWALAELLCGESVDQVSSDVKIAAHLAALAAEVAERVQGPEPWCNALRGWVAGHPANILRVRGELKASRAGFEEAKRFWKAGSDPAGLLDPGRLLDLEASLCRDERRFEEALELLDQALEVSRCPARILINRGFTLEVMGRYEQAVAALREAEPRLDREREPRLYYMQRFNLAVNFCHLGLPAAAAELLAEVRSLAAGRGDENELIRVTWLEGRIAAGLGRREEALALLADARRRFAERSLSYDVALCLLEEAVLLLTEGRTAGVKALALELEEVFQAKGVHREALAALRLFKEAAEREKATAALASRLLTYLFRARHDPGLRFNAS